ncbi:polysaccharide biosynthesis tyrosine autokinase [Leifsonia sp. AG29]|uniref:polysaccharide biosynthesis tyrosine autokinase n=1 Tax=Leifsonia sp. AG29 TaxID=2598860 RepID=UPI00131C59D4|nr:polysaccharide biosynthesis tyrosine autokinase [Leifsonia sp. AG29]
MELRDYLRVFRKNWILIAVCALVGIAIASIYSLAVTPKYQATTELYVSVRAADNAATTDLVQGAAFARQAVSSYVSVATSASVLDRVASDLDLKSPGSSLAGSVTAVAPPNTVLINITVTGADPKLTADIANSVAKNTSYVVTNQLENTQSGKSLVRIQTIQPAMTPTKPTSPNVMVNLLLGLFIGLGLGLVIALLRSILDTRIRNAGDIDQITDRPILGAIKFDPAADKRPVIVNTGARDPQAESFRSVRTNLQLVNADSGPHSFVITSSGHGEGKSTTAANLAITLAETGARVALIDGDLRRPKLAEYLGIEGAIGLSDVLIGRAQLTDVLQKWGRGQLYVLPAGRIPTDPSELLGSAAMASLLADLMGEFDYVIVDTPPLLVVTDAAVLSKLTGAAIIAAAWGRTKKNELSDAVRSLEQIGTRLVGVVVTMIPVKGPDSYGYGVFGDGVQSEIVGDESVEQQQRVRRAAEA